tara:strand:+ start:42 stop:221 length:180 start_codon:yes stop_codon:yes gene_type:complete
MDKSNVERVHSEGKKTLLPIGNSIGYLPVITANFICGMRDCDRRRKSAGWYYRLFTEKP